jgi:type I restriction enzyme S subunit
VSVYGSNGVVGIHDEALTSGPAIIVGRKGSIGEVHLSRSPCWPIDTTYFIDRPKIDVDLAWLASPLKTLDLSSLAKAAAVPGLSREDAYSLELLVPPLAQQEYIVRALGEQMAAVERGAVLPCKPQSGAALTEEREYV